MVEPKPARTSRYALVWRLLLAMLLIAVVLIAASLNHVPRWLGLYYVALGLISATAYWFDKRAAIAGAWRISESTLHRLDFFGGIIGGLMAQIGWRHKTAKPGFGFVSGTIAILHLAGVGAFALGLFDAFG